MYELRMKENFFDMVDSLKKSRRADLSDINDDDDIIEKLYTDPLHNNFVLSNSLRPSTTILIGRKGTGKSTIIARVQHEIRKSNDKLSIYVDVKTIFDSSKSFSIDRSSYQGIMNENDMKKYLLTKTFLREILKQIKREVKTNTWKFYLAKVSSLFGPDKKKFESEVDRIFEKINTDDYEDIVAIKNVSFVKTIGEETSRSELVKTEGQATLSKSPSVNIKENDEIRADRKDNGSIQESFSDILLRYFNSFGIIEKIRDLLKTIGIKHVYICLDDFSEIEHVSMKVFVDTIIAPMNNWSNEFFKFKIAAYPGRYYLGDMDPTKIDQIKLDFYDLYTSNRVSETEREAWESIKRLLDTRSKYFCKEPFEYFIHDKNNINEFYTTLFRIASNVPRNIGWILWYAYQSSVSKDKAITIRDLELAAERYFDDSIDIYFSQNRYMQESFTEKLGKYHLHTLLNAIINEARKNKSEISVSSSKIFEKDRTNPPTSHFYVDKRYEDVLQSLELNFFLTKYSEQKDQDSKVQMSFFSLNYGLCMREDIIYGKGSDRKYVIQRRFNYNRIINSFLGEAKNIVCNYCGKIYPMDDLEKLKFYDMLCSNCKVGSCKIEDVSIDIPLVNEDILLPELDLALLNSLRIDEPQYASQLAQELDCTSQKITRRINYLEDRELVKRKRESHSAGPRTYYYLTDMAKTLYFSHEDIGEKMR